MAGQRTLPNLGLTNLWTHGSSGYDTGLDADLAMLDALLFLEVISATISAPPAAPAVGDRYIVPAGASAAWAGHVGAVAVWVDAAWVFYTARLGWHARVAGAAARTFDGTAWLADEAVVAGSTSLAGDSDVALAALADGDLLMWHATAGKWVNATPAAGNVTLAQLPASVQSLPLSFVIPGKPAAGGVLNLPLALACLLPANLAGTVSVTSAPAAADSLFKVNRLSPAGVVTALATVILGTSGMRLSVQAAVALLAGDALQLVLPTTQDANLANVGITFLSTRS